MVSVNESYQRSLAFSSTRNAWCSFGEKKCHLSHTLCIMYWRVTEDGVELDLVKGRNNGSSDRAVFFAKILASKYPNPMSTAEIESTDQLHERSS